LTIFTAISWHSTSLSNNWHWCCSQCWWCWWWQQCCQWWHWWWWQRHCRQQSS